LSAQALCALANAADDRGYRVYDCNLRIYVEAVGLATYPDGSMTDGPVVEHPPGPKSTIVNPIVLLEVTNDYSEEYDTGKKFGYYRTIPTLCDYIIVSHRERRITVHSRGADGAWQAHVATAGQQAEVSSLGATLVVDEIYRNSAIA
jgi:Uma2 family endonuclease